MSWSHSSPDACIKPDLDTRMWGINCSTVCWMLLVWGTEAHLRRASTGGNFVFAPDYWLQGLRLGLPVDVGRHDVDPRDTCCHARSVANNSQVYEHAYQEFHLVSVNRLRRLTVYCAKEAKLSWAIAYTKAPDMLAMANSTVFFSSSWALGIFFFNTYNLGFTLFILNLSTHMPKPPSIVSCPVIPNWQSLTYLLFIERKKKMITKNITYVSYIYKESRVALQTFHNTLMEANIKVEPEIKWNSKKDGGERKERVGKINSTLLLRGIRICIDNIRH